MGVCMCVCTRVRPGVCIVYAARELTRRRAALRFVFSLIFYSAAYRPFLVDLLLALSL